MPTTHSHLDEAVLRYLTSDTNHALLISGAWGSGKTYYYNHHLVDLIRGTMVMGDEGNFYSPIKVSLFGKRSVQEITDDIYTQLYPFIESSSFKKGGKLVMNAAIGYVKHKTDLDLKEYLPENFIDVKAKIKYQQIVVCFDDLERINTALSFDEVIGYINSLVENDNAKVIIIANENNLQSKVYDTIKEKTIGITVEFELDFEEIFQELVFNRYSATNTPYHDYLLEEKSFITGILKQAKNNLRHIIFTLDALGAVHEKSLEVKPGLTHEQLAAISLFTISTALEFRKRKLTKQHKTKLTPAPFSLGNLNWLDTPGVDVSQEQTPGATQSPERDILEEIREKYFQPSYHYIFFPHIFDYITLSIFLDNQLLATDLEGAFPEEQKMEEYAQVLFELQYENFGALSTKAYREKTSKMIQFAKQGKYRILDVFNVFHFATRFNNPLNLNLEKLTEALIGGMRKNTENVFFYPLQYQLQFKRDEIHHTHLQKLKTAALQVNQRLEAQTQQQGAETVLLLLEQDIKAFGNEVGSLNSGYYFKAVFHYLKPRAFYGFLRRSNYDTLSIILYTLQNRYRKNPDLTPYRQEKAFFESLSSLLQGFVSKNKAKSPINFQLHEIFAEVQHAAAAL